ncbi:hypothetical protein SO802_006394 [Lithocarpus litseifolius]|uniref:Peptidase C1A papain C-terminal domain-containing protein n=1 Tax=Lithocarpus litseifolius TaxID=425828 RepID=A0AAW2DRD7_9ROSI
MASTCPTPTLLKLPYEAINKTCDQEKKSIYAAYISAFEDVPSNNEKALLQAVATQPVSIAIKAYSHDFKFYTSSVFTGECGPI